MNIYLLARLGNFAFSKTDYMQCRRKLPKSTCLTSNFTCSQAMGCVELCNATNFWPHSLTLPFQYHGMTVSAKIEAISVWETKFLGHSPENKCPSNVLYKIPLARANFLLA